MAEKEKFICLMSGGTDSPVACYLMLKREFVPIIVHFHRAPSDIRSDEILKNGVFEIIKILRKYGENEIKAYLISHPMIIAELENANPGKNICILCRRTMYRIARAVALKENASAIVTGESLGEKASQTPTNLFVMKQAIDDFLLIQPLIALTKLEIEKIAKEIGTYEASIQKSRACLAAPKYPITHADLNKILTIEESMDFQGLINRSLKSAEIIYF
jgi:thiamine biosynthesis protein ThiI